MNDKLNKIESLNKALKLPEELGGVFLPTSSQKKFDFMFIAEMPSMNEPKNWDGKRNFNFDVTARDKFLQEVMIKNSVDGSYVTDIVKKRDIPRKPKKEEIKKWSLFLLKEIEIIEPKNIIVLGKRTYETSFKPYIEPYIKNKNIKIDYVFHYSNQVPRNKFEQKFRSVVGEIRNTNITFSE
jgi:uracil-DNA glycosylase family 4